MATIRIFTFDPTKQVDWKRQADQLSLVAVSCTHGKSIALIFPGGRSGPAIRDGAQSMFKLDLANCRYEDVFFGAALYRNGLPVTVHGVCPAKGIAYFDAMHIHPGLGFAG